MQTIASEKQVRFLIKLISINKPRVLKKCLQCSCINLYIYENKYLSQNYKPSRVKTKHYNNNYRYYPGYVIPYDIATFSQLLLFHDRPSGIGKLPL